jgi:D-apionolactonase
VFPVIYDGSGKPPPEALQLTAGPLNLTYEAGMIRYIRLGTHEVVRAVYAAVRDENWGTVPGDLRGVQIEQHGNAFRITFTSDHQGLFVWKGELTGGADGTIRFTFDGEALTDFKRNRVGFCVLHPMEVAGVRCEIEHVDGTVENGVFPEHISPHQPYFDIRAITHDVMPGVRAQVRMEGDTFEMEDQRNWIDASYKTYCTPLALPFPVTLEAGTKVHQTVTIRLLGETRGIQVTDAEPALTVTDAVSRLPDIGLCLSESQVGLHPRLKSLHLEHLRLDLDMRQNVDAKLREAVEASRILGCGLEIALHFTGLFMAELAKIVSAIKSLNPPVARWLVFEHQNAAPPREFIRIARDLLSPVGSGTDAFFTELNRNRPPTDLDWVAYSINPQVHAFDNASVVETLSVMGVTVRSARAFSGSAKIAVTPVTFKMRWNPNATAPEPPLQPGELPRHYDPRQKSLFGAAWTLGAIMALHEADSVTFYETSGVVDKEIVYPMYHIFADVGELRAADFTPLQSAHPLRYGGGLFRLHDRIHILLANYTYQPVDITLNGVSGSFTLKTVDETTADLAMNAPEQFRAEGGKPVDDLCIHLLPYATAHLIQE